MGRSSRSSLGGVGYYGSATSRGSSRRASLAAEPNFVSSLLQRLSMNGDSSSQAMDAKQGSRQPPSNQNATWGNIEGPSAGPPSLADSETSEQTEERSLSLSRSSTQSSLLQLQPPSPKKSDPRYEALHRYYALRRTSLNQQPTASLSGSPEDRNRHHLVRAAPRRTSLQLQHYNHLPGHHHHPHLQGSRGSCPSFPLNARIKEEDAWGQFVDTAEREDDLIRRSRLLAATRTYRAATTPGPYRLRR